MNKMLYYIRNILFVVVAIVLTINVMNIIIISRVCPLIMYVCIFLLAVLFIKQYKKGNKNINYNIQYNFTFIMSLLYIILILLRNLFDSYIMINSYAEYNGGLEYLRNVFLYNNTIYISIILFLLLVYSLILNKTYSVKNKK